MHYYDVENGGVYRNTDEAKQVLCDIYGVDASQFDSLDEAVESITGYDLDLARELLESAYQEALANEDIKETDVVEITFGTSVINDVVTRRHDYIKNAWKELAVGTSLEGRITFSDDAELGNAWADDFRKGLYDVCMGGWSGAAWDPGYFLLAYLSPDYMYSTAWDTSSVQMTFKLEGVMEEEETMSLMDWYNCLNGATGAKYDFSATELEQEQRLPLIAALEAEVLKVYYSVPLYNSFAASLISYKVDYITYEYNTFMGYGGIRYMTYNFDDAAWEAEVAKQGNELNYK
jgi:ABC-type oligopeptide transport system substrate-binding subunit